MNEASPQPWCALYAATMVELDHKLLLSRVEATESAIQARLHDLRHDSDHHAERQEIDDAIRNLTLIRRCYIPMSRRSQRTGRRQEAWCPLKKKGS